MTLVKYGFVRRIGQYKSQILHRLYDNTFSRTYGQLSRGCHDLIPMRREREFVLNSLKKLYVDKLN